MKKLMTSTIILLPLLILAIMLVSGAIMSLVTHIYVETVEFVKNDIVLVLDDESNLPSERLEVNVLPLKAENRDLVYSVEDESVVTVDQNGVVTGQYFGETYITVTSAENKAAVDKLHVLVTDTSVHKVTIDGGYKSDLYMGTAEERTQPLSVSILPLEAKDKRITWSSSDENILTVSPNGTVTAKGAGKATVTATSVDNPDVSASVEIACHSQVERIRMEQSRVVTALSTAKFPDMTIEPADADVTVEYKSSDPSVATVDGQGNITFVNPGQVRITATATDFGGRTAEAVNDYVSTLGYYRAPLFEERAFTVDFDEYMDQNKALPIPFATNLADTYRQVTKVEYTVQDVLDFDEEREEFRFVKEMPVGVRTVTVTVTATGYDTTENELVTLVDAFTLTVLRRAKSIEVAYKGTNDADAIALSSASLTIGTEKAAAAVNVFPANHTDTLSFALENAEGVATLTGGVLTFQKAGTVTVKISSYNDKDELSAAKSVSVSYVPVAQEEHKKGVEVLAEPEPGKEPEKQQVLLSMEESAEEEAYIYFTEPAQTQVTYTVKEGKDEVIELQEENGVRRIVPMAGGFATVEITVTKSASSAARRAARANDEPIVYTIEVYVDKPVTPDSFSVTLGDTPCESIFGTALSAVPFTVAAEDRSGELEGKKFYVSYGTTKTYAESDGLGSFSGNITFDKASSALTVTFGVEYTERALSLGAEGGISSVTRTIRRNAESIKVSYRGTETEKISTTVPTLTLKSTEDQSDSSIGIVVLPANHTNTVSYSLAEGDDVATLNSGVLTFLDPDSKSTVTVKVQVKAWDGTVVKETQFTVTYAPEELGVVNVEVKDKEPQFVRLRMEANGSGAEKGNLIFTEPKDATVDYTVEQGEGVVTLEEEGDFRYITPQKGGFATVKITVTPESGDVETYTLNIYVDRVISVGDFAVWFHDTRCDSLFGTTDTSVSFMAVYNGGDGAMAGKKLYVSYGTAKTDGSKDSSALMGNVAFPLEEGRLTVTFGAEYDDEAKAFGVPASLASVTRTLERNAESIGVTYRGVATDGIVFGSASYSLTEKNSLTVGEGDTDILVTVSPAAHTDTLSYTLEDEEHIAQFNVGSGTLTFSKAGTVTLRLQVKRGDELSVEKSFTVTYAPVGTDVAVELGGASQTKYITLPLNGAATKEGILYFSAPQGEEVTYAVNEADKSVAEIEQRGGVYHIVPKKGGFAKVTVTAGRTVYTIDVYVDTPVTADDFTITFAESVYDAATVYTTSLNDVNYKVEVADNNGSMAGKQLVITVQHSDSQTVPANQHSYSGTIAFGNYSDLTLTVGVQYAAEANAHGKTGALPAQTQRTLRSTHGNLDAAPTVETDGGELIQGQVNTITFDDIGETVTFTVVKEFSPADFVLDTDADKTQVTLEGNGYVTVAITDKGATITLTATRSTNGEQLFLQVANYTFTLNVVVHAKAQSLTLAYGEQTLTADRYSTLLGELTFKATLGRSDGEPIFNRDVEWSFDENAAQWTKVTSDSNTVAVTVSGISAETQYIYFRAADGGTAKFALHISQKPVESYTIRLTTADAEGKEIVLQDTLTLSEAKTLSYALTAKMSGTITIFVTVPESEGETCLGGFGSDEQFKELFPVDVGNIGWKCTHDSVNKQITLSNITGKFNHDVTLAGGSFTVTMNFSSINLAKIDFDGFNSDTDNHRGYQQVRVFAKKSTYKTESGTVDVDYFRMPVAAYEDVTGDPSTDLISLLAWTLTAVNSSTGTETVVAKQTGASVTYQEQPYTVTAEGGGYVLKDKEGNTVVNADGTYVAGKPQVTWVDAFSEAKDGYVRIYFGAFTGLTETDVQNDYFGNFDGRAWTKPTDAEMLGITGTKVEPSDGAFSFLRVEGGDGVKDGGTNRFFNFNVLESTDLFNVDTATGYYAHRNVVLHENLYGTEELGNEGAKYDEAVAKDLFLNETQGPWQATDSTVLGKTTVFGNGYQINLKAKNDQLVQGDPDKRNNSWGVSFGNLYNVTVKCTNQTEKVNVLTHKIVLIFAKSYYCDLQGYTKARPYNSTTYIKNTVLHAASQSGFQLFYSGEKAYFENVTVVDCAAGITNENSEATTDPEHVTNFYFKGNLDVLNYNKLPGLLAMASADESKAGMLGMLLGKEPWANFESFGKKCSNPTGEAYVNLVIYTSNRKGVFNFWNGNGYDLNKKESVVGDNLPMKEILDLSAYKSYLGGSEVTAWTYNYPKNTKLRLPGMTYDYTVTVDGRNFGSNIGLQYFEKMFTEERYIRLLCQYVNSAEDGSLVKNDEHILWHMQQAYRDKSLLTGRENNHMAALRASLTGKNITWPDGTTPEQAMQEYDDFQATLAAQMTDLLSETVLPSKHSD